MAPELLALTEKELLCYLVAAARAAPARAHLYALADRLQQPLPLLFTQPPSPGEVLLLRSTLSFSFYLIVSYYPFHLLSSQQRTSHWKKENVYFEDLFRKEVIHVRIYDLKKAEVDNLARIPSQSLKKMLQHCRSSVIIAFV